MSEEMTKLQEQVNRLEGEIDALRRTFYQNNFSSHQDFNKSVAFNTHLKVPHYTSAPATAEVGRLIEISGVLYISTATDTWTVVGTQS